MLDQNWFAKYQKQLLWLLNTPIVGIWFRKVLRIRGEVDDIGTRKVSLDKIKIGYDIRTHDKFSKRLYFAFKPLWQLIHWWDTLIANQVAPAWNLGFDAF